MQTLFQESRRDSLNTKSIGGLEIFLQADFKIFNFKRFLNFSAQNGRPNIITYQEQKERVVGDSKKPYTNPNHTNNHGQVILIKVSQFRQVVKSNLFVHFWKKSQLEKIILNLSGLWLKTFGKKSSKGTSNNKNNLVC